MMGKMQAINNRELADAKKRMRAEVENYFTERLVRVCDRLVEDAVASKEYKNLTGNTVTSYTCGLYVNGSLSYVVQSGEGMTAPVRKKLRKGEYHYFNPDYDGVKRGAKGTVETDGGWGTSTAMSFVMGYKPRWKRGFAIVMTTGTEYSEFLEQEHDLNVLTDTYEYVSDVMFNNFKPIPS